MRMRSGPNTALRVALAIWLAGCLELLPVHGQPPPPPAAPPPPRPAPPRSIERRLREIRGRLERNVATTPEQRELAGFARRYLEAAEQAAAAHQQFRAECLAGAADACRRPLDHLQQATRPEGPKGGAPPPPDQIRQLYFRLKLSDYFLEQIPAPAPRRLLELARGFYEQAVTAQQNGRTAEAAALARSGDDLTHALESLAQAATSR